MVYVYKCSHCNKETDIIKSVTEIDRLEKCECGHIMDKDERTISFRGIFQGEKDWDKAEFNKGLGCITKNAKHRRQICKERGLEELGNEPIDKFHKDMDARRDQKVKEIYDRADK
jgi:hypothetical protein